MKNFPKHALVLTLPKIMDFDEDYKSAATVIGIFRRALIHRCRIGYIDFSHMKRISPACLTVFSCYADLWKMTQPKVTPWTHTWMPNIIEAFRQIGFFGALGFSDAMLPPREKTDSIRYMGLKNFELNSFNTSLGEEVKGIREQIEAFVGKKFNRQTMFASVTEAIQNIKDHAYTREPVNNLKRKWWLSVSHDLSTNIVHIIIFDRGLGIPTTMLESSKFSDLRRLIYKTFGSWSQKDRLRLAFERYRNPGLYAKAVPIFQGRGRGCQDLLQLVDAEMQGECEMTGTLSVISQKARYEYKTEFQTSPGKVKSEKLSLEGTLLEWRLKLNGD